MMITMLRVGFITILMSYSITSLAMTTQVTPANNDNNCLAQDQWFPYSKVTMPAGEKFDGETNCAFHRWAWQMFLWAMQDVDGKPRFLNFSTPYELLGIESRDSLLPRITKSMQPRSLDEYLQAGTEGILVDQAGNPVYYSQYLNQDFVDFVKKNNLTDPKSFQKIDPKTTFSVDVAEFKASWKIIDDDVKNKDSFFTMKAPVYLLANKNGKIVVDPTQSREVDLALVGFHIAGVVKDHPEMIWATFEHQDNAPDVPENVTPKTIVSERDWTFYKANTPYVQCNMNYASSPDLKLDEKTQKITPVTQVCRQFAFGNDPSQKDFSVPTNIRVVKQLNEDTKTRLSKDGQLPKNRQWLTNYFEVSAIWFKQPNALEPNMSLTTNVDKDGKQLLIGGLHLSNSTIETFTQNQSTMDNCFRCHNTTQIFPPKGTNLNPLQGTNLNISHALVNMYFWAQEKDEMAKK